MTNKEFINIVHKVPEEIPAFNFYKASEDIYKMLKVKIERSELTKPRIDYIIQQHNKLAEWSESALMSEAEKTLLKNNIKYNQKILNYEKRILEIELLIKSIQNYEDKELLKVIGSENWELMRLYLWNTKIPNTNKAYRMPMYETVGEQINLLTKLKNTADGQRKREQDKIFKKVQAPTTKFDFMEAYTILSQSKTMRPPLDISLSEWVYINKLVIKENKKDAK